MPETDVTELAGDAPVDDLKLKRDLILRIAHSENFRAAQMLQHLLLYLAEKGSSGEAGALKEYSIGVDALGRKQDFDPKVDPIVRVQMHRLRQKLKEYYATEGAGDPLVLEIPKGNYLPTFINASMAGPVEPAATREGSDSGISAGGAPVAILLDGEVPSRKWGRGKQILIGIAAFAFGVLSTLLWMRTVPKSASAVPGSDTSADPVEVFWKQFLGNDTSPIIGYPDAIFLLDESNDLFRFRQGATDQRGALVTSDVIQHFAANPLLADKAGPLYYENGYTGTGELESIAMLTSVFAKMGAKPIIKSSRDITTADLKQHNVILLGSPFQNRAVAQLPPVGDFVFENPDAHRELWRGRILDLHPRANEDSKYQTERDPATGVLKSDYGVITIMQGIEPNVHIGIIGGLDTTGTQGVTSFAVSSEGVIKMRDAMTSLMQANIDGFQVLLKVNLEMGYQVLDFQPVALHEMKKTSAGQGKR